MTNQTLASTEQHLRIYVPAVLFSSETHDLLSKQNGIIELRCGFNIPFGNKLKKVWNVEFENSDTSPKFFAKNLPHRNIDEIVQTVRFPSIRQGTPIVTTQYLQSQISKEQLEEFKQAPCWVRIYDGEHPQRSGAGFGGADGTIILAEPQMAEIIERTFAKQPYGICITKENLIYSSG